ncbi:hypothetical protein GGR26_000192 [Lewinella marina]|uniref:Lipoprotein n=1 Tax=Neolewinella marina TaxID=438751 RepID=A0A2G0CK56_9BACT|nr:hypothetical protein [Neolewinella marina]NJB84447.1 hypothetical protein [Neolewinella marina]PHL00360.1 hypothetical protein CGL56_04820 [Neolewinella marina]
MNKLSVLPLLLLAFLSFACEKDEALRLTCGPDIRIVGSVEGLASDHFILESARVEDRCLTVEIGASGCTADHWTLDLVTTGNVAESNPTQSSARLIFDDQVDEFTCMAYLTRTFSFDLSPYLSEEALPSELSLIGTDTVLLVE